MRKRQGGWLVPAVVVMIALFAIVSTQVLGERTHASVEAADYVINDIDAVWDVGSPCEADCSVPDTFSRYPSYAPHVTSRSTRRAFGVNDPTEIARINAEIEFYSMAGDLPPFLGYVDGVEPTAEDYRRMHEECQARARGDPDAPTDWDAMARDLNKRLPPPAEYDRFLRGEVDLTRPEGRAKFLGSS